MGWKRLLLFGALGSLSVTAALAIAILLFGDFGDTEARILGTTFAISLYSLLTLPGAVLLERRRAEPLAYTTIVLAVVAFVLALAGLWEVLAAETGWKAAGIATAVAAAATQIAALTSRRREDDSSSVRGAYALASAVALLLAAMVTYAIARELDSEPFFRALAALAVVDVFLIVLQPLLRRLGGGSVGRERVVLEGTREELDEALRRIEGTGVRIRR